MVAAAALALVALGDDDGVILCPFRRCTGGYCPLCGGTRAGRRLLRLDLAGAWAAHPFVVLLVAQVPVVAAVAWFGQWRHQSNRFLLLNGVVATTIWILRLFNEQIPAPSTLQLPF